MAKVVPVRIRLVEGDTTRLFRRTRPAGGAYYGRYGRTAKISPDETKTYQIQAEVLDPIPYTTKRKRPVRALRKTVPTAIGLVRPAADQPKNVDHPANYVEPQLRLSLNLRNMSLWVT